MDSARYWRRKARITALRFNFARWLAAFLPLALSISLGFAPLLLLFRHFAWPGQVLWIVFAALLIGAAAFSWLRNRREFFSLSEGLTRLDIELGLHNRLISAEAGLGEFPTPHSKIRDGFRWNASRIAILLAGIISLPILATLLPVTHSEEIRTPQIEPPAWTEVETWVERLAESEIPEPRALESLQEKLEELRGQPAGDWYRHSSLEAGDHLKQQTAESIRAMQAHLQNASSALQSARDAQANGSQSNLETSQANLTQALQGLSLGNLPLNQELAAQLSGLDLSQVRQLSPEELQALQERLEQGTAACEQCVGMQEIPMLAEGEGEGAGSGTGEIQRGPGDAPLALSRESRKLESGQLSPLSSENHNRLLPGELAGLSQSEHEVDETSTASGLQAGTIQSAGRGGDAALRSNLTPQEEQVLKRFFQ